MFSLPQLLQSFLTAQPHAHCLPKKNKTQTKIKIKTKANKIKTMPKQSKEKKIPKQKTMESISCWPTTPGNVVYSEL